MNYFISIDLYFVEDPHTNDLIPKKDKLHELIRYIYELNELDPEANLFVINANVNYSNEMIIHALQDFFDTAREREFKIPNSSNNASKYFILLQPNTFFDPQQKEPMTNFLYIIKNTEKSQKLHNITIIDERIESFEFAEQHGYKTSSIKKPQTLPMSQTQIAPKSQKENPNFKKPHLDSATTESTSKLLNFPDEILLMITVNLDRKSLFSFALSAKRFPNIVNQALFQNLTNNAYFQFSEQQKLVYSPNIFNLFHFTNCLDKITSRFLTLCQCDANDADEFEQCYGDSPEDFFVRQDEFNGEEVQKIFTHHPSLTIRNHKYAALVTENLFTALGIKAFKGLSYQSSLLHFIIAFCDIKAFDFLFEKGFDPYDQNEKFITPVDVLHISLTLDLSFKVIQPDTSAKHKHFNQEALLKQTRFLSHLIYKGIDLCRYNHASIENNVFHVYIQNLLNVLENKKLEQKIYLELIHSLAVILVHYKGLKPENVDQHIDSARVFSYDYNNDCSKSLNISEDLQPLLHSSIEEELTRLREIKLHKELHRQYASQIDYKGFNNENFDFDDSDFINLTP